jgi:plastocyanin
VQFSDSGTYTVTVTNVTTQTVTSNPAILKVNPAPIPPSITVQPQSITTLAGDTVTFSVTATGTPPLTYSWLKNGTPVPKGTSPICTLSNVQFSDSGIYTVTVSNVTSQIATSNQAILKVNPAPVAPSISVQPQSQTVTAGQNVMFSVTATGTAPLSYLWSKDGAAITGANSSSYSIAGVQTSDAATYTVTISNGISPDATSSGAVLTVNSITLQPQSTTANIGDNVTFTATTTGATPNSYQWYKDGVMLPGNSSSYSISNVQTTDAGNYYVTESNGTSPDPQSNTVGLTVN